jgi:signal transduction histidine kinase
MLKTTQILCFCLFNYYTLLPLIDDNLITEIIQDLHNELLEIQIDLQENTELDEYLDKDDLQQILDINIENNHQIQNILQELLELSKKESESYFPDLNEVVSNNELVIPAGSYCNHCLMDKIEPLKTLSNNVNFEIVDDTSGVLDN